MLGVFWRSSAAAFAFNNAGIRRGVLTGSVLQAMAITVPIGVPIFLFFAVVTGFLGAVTEFPPEAIVVLASAGILNFVWARYCIYRATKAIGMNLVAPLQQLNLVVTLVLAVFVLEEKLDTLRWLGIALVVLGPAITTMGQGRKSPAATGGAPPGSRRRRHSPPVQPAPAQPAQAANSSRAMRRATPIRCCRRSVTA